uniref:Uncharacterized protein n=1 Tax=Cannabis sativa TaxID=3483 RepID=A0A803R877_CANSA
MTMKLRKMPRNTLVSRILASSPRNQMEVGVGVVVVVGDGAEVEDDKYCTCSPSTILLIVIYRK